MPFYKITEKGVEQPRLVKAQSAKAAIQFCVGDRFSAETVTSVEEAADLFEAGVKIEKVEDAPPQQEKPPEQETEPKIEVGKGGKPPADA